MLVRMQRNWIVCALLGGLSTGAGTLESRLWVSSKTKVHLLCNSAVALLGISQRNESYVHVKPTGVHSIFICSSSKLEMTLLSYDDKLKNRYLHTTKYWSVTKSDKPLIRTTWVDLKRIVLSEKGRSQMGTYYRSPLYNFSKWQNYGLPGARDRAGSQGAGVVVKRLLGELCGDGSVLCLGRGGSYTEPYMG